MIIFDNERLLIVWCLVGATEIAVFHDIVQQ